MPLYDRTLDFIATLYAYPVHNTFLLLAAESGVPALLLVLSLVGITMFKALRLFYRHEGILEVVGMGIFASLLTWILHNQVNLTYVFEDYTLWFLFGLIASLDRYYGPKSGSLAQTVDD